MGDVPTDQVSTISWETFFSQKRSTWARLVFVKALKDRDIQGRKDKVPQGFRVSTFDENCDHRML